MPIEKVGSQYKYGKSGKLYPTKKQALKQAAAMHASGYKDNPGHNSSNPGHNDMMHDPKMYAKAQGLALQEILKAVNKEIIGKKHKGPVMVRIGMGSEMEPPTPEQEEEKSEEYKEDEKESAKYGEVDEELKKALLKKLMKKAK